MDAFGALACRNCRCACKIEKDECGSSPCQNGGTCTDVVANYTCACPAGWYGYDCEFDFDECLSSPCQNGATCSDQAYAVGSPIATLPRTDRLRPQCNTTTATDLSNACSCANPTPCQHDDTAACAAYAFSQAVADMSFGGERCAQSLGEAWTDCGAAAPSGTAPDGSRCTFPFEYRGVTHIECTMVDGNAPWCYTGPEGVVGEPWGICDCEVVQVTRGMACSSAPH